jgi:hypothetical protein
MALQSRSIFAGGAKLLLAFALGVLAAVVPLYYLLVRDAAPDGANSSHSTQPAVAKQIQTAAEAPVSPGNIMPLASRMTYELTSVIPEPVSAPRDIQAKTLDARPTPSPTPGTASAGGAAVELREQAAPVARVVNARRIAPVERQPTGKAVETAPQSQHRDITVATSGAAPPGRVIEGREVRLRSRPVEDR